MVLQYNPSMIVLLFNSYLFFNRQTSQKIIVFKGFDNDMQYILNKLLYVLCVRIKRPFTRFKYQSGGPENCCKSE